MTDVIAVIAAGEMGSGIGKRLTERGARVLTSLKGRGSASAARAQAAGMADVEDSELVNQAGMILSVVPPGEAIGPSTSRRLSPNRPSRMASPAASPET